jgi:hypothetical protein
MAFSVPSDRRASGQNGFSLGGSGHDTTGRWMVRLESGRDLETQGQIIHI